MFGAGLRPTGFASDDGIRGHCPAPPSKLMRAIRRRDLWVVLAGPSLLGSLGGAVVAAVEVLARSGQETNAAIATLTGLVPLGALAGATFALAAIPLAAGAVWWNRAQQPSGLPRRVTAIAATCPTATMMFVSASSASTATQVKSWALSVVAVLGLLYVNWLLLGWLLPGQE